MAKSAPIVRKLSIKIMLGKKPRPPTAEEIKANPEKYPEGIKNVVRFYGVATGTRTGVSDKGEWCALLGSFKAINLETGEEKRSGTCFIPGVALDLITPQLAPGKANAVEFGFDIGVKEDEDSATGYVYTAAPCMEVAENDPLELLTKRIDDAQKALPAPEETKTRGKKATPEAAAA